MRAGGPDGQTPARDDLASQAVRGSMYSIAASAVTLASGFLRTILLARLLLPQHFGVVSLALFYIGLLGQLRGLGLDAAVIHRQDGDERFMRTYFTFRFGLDGLTLGLLLSAVPFLQRIYPDVTELSTVLPALILAYFLHSLSQVQEALLRKNLAFSSLAATDVAASLMMTVVAPYLAWRGWGVWALVAEQMSGLGTRFLLAWGPFRQWWPKLGWDREEARWLWAYGKPTWLAANIGYLLDRFDDFWIGTALGKTALGYYSRSYEFAHYPRRVFANPIVAVFGPVFARVQNDRLRLSQLFYRSAHFILRTGFLVAGAFALVMPEFIHFVIGDKWLPVLWTFRLMLVYAVLDPLIVLIGNLMLAVGRPREMQNVGAVQMGFFIPAVILGAYRWGINGVALAADGMLLAGAWRYYRPLREVVDFSLSHLVAWPALALVVAWGTGFGIETFVTGALWQVLALKLGAFLLLFGGFLLITERGDYFRGLQWLWRALRERRGEEE